jgi:thioredoxin 1
LKVFQNDKTCTTIRRRERGLSTTHAFLLITFINKLLSMSAQHFTEENFDQLVLQESKPVLVDFWAPWCGPCQMMSPVIDELAGEMEDAVVGKINVDENPSLAQRHNILSIPTFLIYKGGQVVDQFSGAMKKDDLKERLAKHV